MTTLSQYPTYNLRAVLKDTGLKADVLRAWERRYDLPRPHRTPGGHRLYSEYDIETVKWLKSRQADGLRISRAVELWKDIVGSGQDPLAGSSSVTNPPALDRRLPVADTRIDTLRQFWLEANLAFDNILVDEILNQAFAIYPVETVCTEILQKGIYDIGNYWYLDKVTVQQEHFASVLVNRRLETLIAATPRPTLRQTVLIGCPPGERHVLSVLLLSLFLGRKGYKVIYLGADVPIEQMEDTFVATQADLVVLAAQQLTTAATLQSAAFILQGQGIPLAFGGLIFNRLHGLREHIPAHFLGESLEEAISWIEQLVINPTPSSNKITIDETYRKLSRLYQEKRHLIEIALFEELKKGNTQTEYIIDANRYFSDGLSAALEFGDVTFLEADLEWVKRLLSGRQIPSESLGLYLAAYSSAIRKEMGNSGVPITAWISSYMAQNEAAQL